MTDNAGWYGVDNSPVYPDWPSMTMTEGDLIVLCIMIGWIPALILIGKIQWWIYRQIQRRK